jgi:hypothetical protein
MTPEHLQPDRITKRYARLGVGVCGRAVLIQVLEQQRFLYPLKSSEGTLAAHQVPRGTGSSMLSYIIEIGCPVHILNKQFTAALGRNPSKEACWTPNLCENPIELSLRSRRFCGDMTAALDEQPLRSYFSQSENFQVSNHLCSFQVNLMQSKVHTLISGSRMNVLIYPKMACVCQRVWMTVVGKGA